MAGLIIPHDNGFAIAVVEKVEDLVSILFIPIVSFSSSVEPKTQYSSVFYSLWFENKSRPS